MPKKRLTELLQEEAEKFTPSGYENAIEVTAEKVIETADTEISVFEETKVKSNLETTGKRTNSTKSELEITIKNLQESLTTYQNQETALKQEVVKLKSALSEQKFLTEKLGKELYETKKTALKLAESNSQLIEEMNELKNTTAKQAKETVQEPVKETVQQPIKEVVKETSKSITVHHHKSYKTPIIITSQTNQTKDDFNDKTWLFD